MVLFALSFVETKSSRRSKIPSGNRSATNASKMIMKKSNWRGPFGVYVFGIRWSNIFTPWYVGKTIAAKGFRGEIFQYHKRMVYNDVIEDNNGDRLIFLFPLLTPKRKFSRSRSAFNERLVDWVEKMLFGLTFSKNPDCSNKHSMKFLRECTVNGVMALLVQGGLRERLSKRGAYCV